MGARLHVASDEVTFDSCAPLECRFACGIGGFHRLVEDDQSFPLFPDEKEGDPEVDRKVDPGMTASLLEDGGPRQEIHRRWEIVDSESGFTCGAQPLSGSNRKRSRLVICHHPFQSRGRRRAQGGTQQPRRCYWRGDRKANRQASRAAALVAPSRLSGRSRPGTGCAGSEAPPRRGALLALVLRTPSLEATPGACQASLRASAGISSATASTEKSRPTTAAHPSTDLSPGPRRSRRATRRACNEGGRATRTGVLATLQSEGS